MRVATDQKAVVGNCPVAPRMSGQQPLPPRASQGPRQYAQRAAMPKGRCGPGPSGAGCHGSGPDLAPPAPPGGNSTCVRQRGAGFARRLICPRRGRRLSRSSQTNIADIRRRARCFRVRRGGGDIRELAVPWLRKGTARARRRIVQTRRTRPGCQRRPRLHLSQNTPLRRPNCAVRTIEEQTFKRPTAPNPLIPLPPH